VKLANVDQASAREYLIAGDDEDNEGGGTFRSPNDKE